MGETEGSDMIEKAARAMCEAQGIDPDHICIGVGQKMPLGNRYPAFEYRIPDARAAIAALRQPTPEMIHAAEMTGLIGGDRNSFHHAVIVYTAMIDALLAETEKPDD